LIEIENDGRLHWENEEVYASARTIGWGFVGSVLWKVLVVWICPQANGRVRGLGQGLERVVGMLRADDWEGFRHWR
jgi:hypothetical protein